MPKTKKEQPQQTQPQQTQPQQTQQQTQSQDEDLQALLTNIYAKLTQLDEKIDRLRKSLYWHRKLSERKYNRYYSKNYSKRNKE